jgi:ribosome-associated toxin RatA of RatAB toxin-antitoxin module
MLRPGKSLAIAGLVALTLAPAPGRAAGPVVIDARFLGNAVEVSASARLRASARLIWQTLTDYNHLARFVPGMTSSRVVGHRDGAVMVAQTGTAGILFFEYPIDVVVAAYEHPRSSIEMKLVRGDMRRLEGTYRIEPVPGGDATVLRWQGIVEPDLLLPPIIGIIALRDDIAAQFRGVVGEIERRAGTP